MDVGRTGADFVIVKVTDGTSYNDPAAAGFARQIIDAGMLGGGYHFWQAGQSATAQADHFVSVMKPVIGRALLVLDWESSDTGNVSGAKAFLDRVYAKTGVRPLIYMSQSVAAGHNWSSVAKDYALWVARYGTSSYGDTGAWAKPAMWQHTSSGRVPGYSGNVDLDYFYGDKAAWRAFASGDAAPTPTPDPGDDDMPEWKKTSYPTDWSFTADGEFRTLKMNTSEDGKDVYYSVLNAPAYATGVVSVTLTGLSKGYEANLRFVQVDTEAGKDTDVVYTGNVTEHFAGSGTTSLTLPFTVSLNRADDKDVTRKLRFQIRAFGGEKVTVTETALRMLFWKR